MQLPVPTDDALRTSQALAARVRADIEAAGGWLSFERYMRRVLYEPGLGYYSAGSVKFGLAGDFVTAPELSPLFGRLLAAQIAPLLRQLSSPTILELGAGTGVLAAQLLDSLRQQGLPQARYLILEPSADLRERQMAALAGFAGQVQWLDTLPAEPLQAVVVANEVADALPVACFTRYEDRIVARGVGLDHDAFRWLERPADAALEAAVEVLEQSLGERLADGYESEFCLMLPHWLRSIAATIERGALLLVDYGLVRREYYHPARRRGTLICHYRHRAHDNPFLWPGLQDLTAWVDFSACADAALQAGLEVAGFTTQGQFLVERAAADPEALNGATPAQLAAFKTLILPGEMGERFKLMLLNRGLQRCRLAGRDMRAWL